MCYNIIKVLYKTTLALSIVICGTKASLAQGTVSLLEETENLPGETTSLFEEDFNSGLLSPGSVGSENTVGSNFTQAGDGNMFSEVPVGSDVSAQPSTVSLEGLLPDNSNLSDSVIDNIPGYGSNIPTQPVSINDNFGEDILAQIDDTLFSQMSDIEKQTALLTLELRRERIKTEIEAIRSQRQKAIDLEEEEKEKKRREKIEWETEQQKKLLNEQIKLQEAALKLEEARQEKIVNAYKNEMLQVNQKWIETVSKAYTDSKEAEKERDAILTDTKEKMTSLASLASRVGSEAITAKENYQREIQNLQTQISILNSRIETLNTERTEGVDNPFAVPGFGTTSDPNIKLSDEYIILEIKGKGDNLVAKISNKSGAEAFLVQRGTTLKSGHVIEEIAPTFIRADKAGEKDFIYFSAGGILDKEPDSELKLKNVFPMGINSSSADPASKGGKNSKRPPERVSDSFIEQMFAN